MVIEPINLIGKRIADAFFKNENKKLVLILDDAKEVEIEVVTVEDEISGDEFGIEEITISSIYGI